MQRQKNEDQWKNETRRKKNYWRRIKEERKKNGYMETINRIARLQQHRQWKNCEKNNYEDFIDEGSQSAERKMQR